ncbi:diguanylate cyclase [Vibrio lentus]|nr:diguanylate cyclase [Vibrio lentus]
MSSYRHYGTTMCERKLPLTIMLCDIDFFKGYNDFLCGHQQGDDALVQVSRAFKQVHESFIGLCGALRR